MGSRPRGEAKRFRQSGVRPPSPRPPSGRPQDGDPPPAADPALVERGRDLTAASDGVACHTVQGGQVFAGGRPLQTPFGTIPSSNLAPDKTGIGGWTGPQIYRDLQRGVDDEGEHLDRAFPDNDDSSLTQGEAIFRDTRSACHGLHGEGTPRFFPPRQEDAGLQRGDPTALTLAPAGAQPSGGGGPG